MPGRAQDVRPQDPALVEGAVEVRVDEARRALRQRPFRARVVLRLHGAEPVHHGRSLARLGAHEPLTMQAAGDEFRCQRPTPRRPYLMPSVCASLRPV